MTVFISGFLLGIICCGDGRVEIVSYEREIHNVAFEKYAEQFPVSPTDAWKLIKEDAPRTGDATLIGRVKFMKLEGIVNDEYVFVHPSTIKKTHFVFFGYHVNVHTGAVRYLRREDIKFEYGGLFPDGYGDFDRIKRYYIPLK